MKQKLEVPVAKFRIKLPGSGFYFLVLVHRTERAMQTMVKEVYNVGGRTYDAICLVVSEKTRKIGDIHFAQGFLNIDSISHESMHAAIAWARRKGLSFAEDKNGSRYVTDDEELIVTAAGRLTRQIVEKLTKLGLLKHQG
jgi:hypothetical protein